MPHADESRDYDEEPLRPLPRDLVCSIVGDNTYLSGAVHFDRGRVIVAADDFEILGDAKLVGPVRSHKPYSLAHTPDDEWIEGTVETQDKDWVTILTPGGARRYLRIDHVETPPFRRHAFELAAPLTVRCAFVYEGALQCEVKSRQVARSSSSSSSSSATGGSGVAGTGVAGAEEPSTIAIQQQVIIRNSLPFDTLELRDLRVSFQRMRASASYSYRESRSEASAAPRAAGGSAEVREAIKEVATPVALGAVSLRGRSSTTFPPRPVVEAAIVKSFVEIYLSSYGDNQGQRMWTIRPNRDLLPSDVRVEDDGGAPVMTYHVHQTVAGGTTNVSLGPTSVVFVEEVASDDFSFRAVLESASKRSILVHLRVNGKHDAETFEVTIAPENPRVLVEHKFSKSSSGHKTALLRLVAKPFPRGAAAGAGSGSRPAAGPGLPVSPRVVP